MAITRLPVPTFRIHRADGSRPLSLKNAFVLKEWLTQEDMDRGFIEIEDGTKWQLSIQDKDIRHVIHSAGRAWCVVSYQAHTYGNFAIAKLFREQSKDKEKGE
jgi:hypothetical protein